MGGERKAEGIFLKHPIDVKPITNKIIFYCPECCIFGDPGAVRGGLEEAKIYG